MLVRTYNDLYRENQKLHERIRELESLLADVEAEARIFRKNNLDDDPDLSDKDYVL